MNSKLTCLSSTVSDFPTPSVIGVDFRPKALENTAIIIIVIIIIIIIIIIAIVIIIIIVIITIIIISSSIIIPRSAERGERSELCDA